MGCEGDADEDLYKKLLDKGRVSKFNKKFQNFRTEKKN